MDFYEHTNDFNSQLFRNFDTILREVFIMYEA